MSDVIFGKFDISDKIFNLVNHLIILGKFFLYKARLIERRPDSNFDSFISYLKSVKDMEIKFARRGALEHKWESLVL